MEDSVRKSFEGFELPVTDGDWSRISTALDQNSRRRGFWYWIKSRFAILALALLILGGATVAWLSLSDRKADPTENAFHQSNTGTGVQELNPGNPSASGEAIKPNSTDGQEYRGSQPEPSQGTPESRISRPAATASRPVVTAAVKPIATEGNKEKNPAPGNEVKRPEIIETPYPIKTYDFLKAFGLRFMGTASEPGISKAYPLEYIAGRKIKKPVNPEPELSYYTSLQTTFSPGKVSFTPTQGIWQGYNWLAGSNPALDLRLEGGLVMGGEKIKFTVGAGFEGNPFQTKSNDTIRIKVADRYLPYKDQNGNTLYYLAVRWRDSVVVLRSNPMRMWAEIPLGVTYKFGTGGGKDWKITTGFSLNPGVMIGSRAEIANPYRTQSGSYWDYVHGIKNADTVSAVIGAREFLNPLRLGSGIQVGIEKDLGHLNLGLQLQSRYYFTPVWKSGVPLKQNTLQYGISFRLGYKI